MPSMLPLALIALLLLPATLCSSSFSPAPAPARGSDVNMVPDAQPPYFSRSPPAPPPHANDSPASASSPSPTAAPASSSAEAPEPGRRGSVKDVNVGDDEKEETAGEGMSCGKKAGVAIGVVAGAAVVGLAGLVYKKRQEDRRRVRYAYVARQMI